MRFKDRRDAGAQLAGALAGYKGKNAVVYALPRGGAVLGAEVARQLELPLELVIPRKIGHPENPEYAVCAVTEDGEPVCNEDEASRLDPKWLAAETKKELAEAKRRRRAYRGNLPRISAMGKIAIIVDDGIATGLTMRAAIHSLRREKPNKIIVVVPVAPATVVEELSAEVDEVICLDSGPYLGAVGAYYEHFPQVSDAEVIKLLAT